MDTKADRVVEFILENRSIKHQYAREYNYDLLRVFVDRDKTVGEIFLPNGQKV